MSDNPVPALPDLLALRWITKALSFRPFDNPSVRKVFHWNFSAAVIPGTLGVVLGMTSMGQFRTAYGFTVIFALWTACWWLTSDHLSQKRKAITSRKARRDIAEFHSALHTYRRHKWVGIAAVLIVTCFIWWRVYDVHSEKITDQLLQERKETYDGLIMSPLPIDARDSSDKIGASITNNGHAELDTHQFACEVIGVVNLKTQAIMGSAIGSSKSTESLGLLGGGRGESAYCHPGMHLDGPLWCADIITAVRFALRDQPKIYMTKNYRFTGRVVSGRFEWTQQNIDDPRDLCSFVNSR